MNTPQKLITLPFALFQKLRNRKCPVKRRENDVLLTLAAPIGDKTKDLWLIFRQSEYRQMLHLAPESHFDTPEESPVGVTLKITTYWNQTNNLMEERVKFEVMPIVMPSNSSYVSNVTIAGVFSAAVAYSTLCVYRTFVESRCPPMPIIPSSFVD
ncbi:MAG: hypothetical protein V4467_01945 [Patescibacteria group bacterium]